MAKILNQDVEYINKIVKTRLDADYSSYSRFLETAPIFCTYYRQNRIESTTDTGMGNVIGNNTVSTSAKRYDRIQNVPLFNVDKSTFEVDFEDNRIKAEYKSEATLLPNTVQAIPEDYLVIHYIDDKDYVFKVTDFYVDNIKSDNYFKIDFKFESHDISYLEDDVIDTFICVYERIGTEDKCLIRDSHYYSLENLITIYDDIRQKYLEEFFFMKADCFILDYGYDVKLYDPYLTKFISDNRLFEKERSFKSYHIVEKINPLKGFNKKYNKSIYSSLEKRKPIDYNIKFMKTIITNINCYFGSAKREFYEINLFGDTDAELLFQEDYLDFNMYDNKSIGNQTIDNYSDMCGIDCECDIVFNDDHNADINRFKYLISMYLNNSDNDNISNYVNDNLSDIILNNDIRYFLYTPMVLFIIKYLIDNIKVSN